LQKILSELLQEYPQVSSNSTLQFGVLMMQAKYLVICWSPSPRKSTACN